MVYVHLANGFEEIEALTVADLLRRAGIGVQTVSITGDKRVMGTHDIPVEADILYEEANYEECEMIVLPGGLPGADHLGNHAGLTAHIRCFAENDKFVAAICAAPMVFGAQGILEGKKATIYPGMEDRLKGAQAQTDNVVQDGKIITSRGPATAMPFALKLIEVLKGKDASDQVAAGLFMERKVDYHIHTWFSDGKTAPAEIVKQAKALGYDEIAITDHDGMDGIAEALAAGDKLGLSVIPGVELATETEEGLGLHILGYHLDMENPKLQEALEDLKKKRADRNNRLLAKLEEMGYPLTREDLQQQPGQHYIGKPVIARAMEAKGYIGYFKDAFEEGKFLESPELKAIKKEKLQAKDAIALIKHTGGIAVLAHPIQIDDIGEKGSPEFYENLDNLIYRLKDQGLSGIECYHPDHNKENEQNFVRLAEKYDLKITRGSDFHGDVFE